MVGAALVDGRRDRLLDSIWLGAALLGTWLRVAGVAGQPLHGDEGIATKTIERGYGTILSTFDGKGSHAGYMLLQRMSMDLLGASVLSYRLPSIAAGVLTLWLLYPLGRSFAGRSAAVLATVFLAVHPMHVYYSRFARPYAVAVLAIFALLVALQRALSGRRSAWQAVFLLSVLVPWIHLSASGALALLAVASTLWTWRTGRSVRTCVVVFGGAALVCLLLHLPAQEGVRAYLAKIAGLERRSALEPAEVLVTLGGVLASGTFLVVLGGLGALSMLRRSPRDGILLSSAIFAPLLTLWITGPGGGEWAYARYMLAALVPMLLAGCWAFVELGRRVLRSERATFALGCGLVLAQARAGPLHFLGIGGTFAHSPWTVMFDTPKADEAFEPVPAIYRELASSPRRLNVVEFPFASSATLLYRCYENAHRQRALVGLGQEGRGLFTAAPYVYLDDIVPPEPGVDWVIFHVDLRAEILRYHRFLGLRGAERIPPMERKLSRLEERWGAPDYRDAEVVAWRLGER
jgi:hypothetical protein